MRCLFALILLCFFVVSYAQDIIINDNDSTVITEYNDGKLWVYRQLDEYVVGISCYEARDDYGKYYQIQLFINNLGSQRVTFDPDDITAYLTNKKGETVSLEVYTNEEFQKKLEKTQNWAVALYGFSAGLNASNAGYFTSYSTTYSPNGYAYRTRTTHYNPNAAYQANLAANAQIITLGKVMADERVAKEQGYLKKSTIYPNESIVGYMNIKRKKGRILMINVPINGNMCSFEWDVDKKK